MPPARKRLLAAFGAVALVAAGLWWVSDREPRMPSDPLAAVPDGATAVGWLDVGAVRGSPLWSKLVTDRGGEKGIDRIESQCGFDPLDQLRDLVVFVNGESPRSLEHVGFVGRGELDRSALSDCVRKVVGKEGGSVERVDIDGVPAIAGGKGSSRAAFVARDGVAVGSEQTVRGVLGVVRDDAASMSTDATLRRLWKHVAGGREVVVVAHVPERWRHALQRYVDERLGGSLGPLEAFGLGARVSDGLGLGVSLEMGSANHAKALVSALRRTVEHALDDPLLSLSAAGSALRAIETDVSGSEAVITVDLREGQVEELVELVQDRLARKDAPAGHDADKAPAPAPDEVVRRTPE